LIATIDADLQESPTELDRLLSVLEQGADMVIGWRHQRRDGVGKRISSFLYNRAVRLVGGPPLHDGNCGFKLMRKELARELPLSGGRFRFMQLVANHWGYRVREVQVSHRKRQTGNSHFGPLRAFSAALDLVVVLALLQGHSRPGILFLKWGLVSALPGSVILAFIAYLRIFEGSIQHRFPLLALGVMCFCSAAFAVMLPGLALSVGRGRLAAAIRISAVMAALVAVTLVVAAVLGASPAAYSIVS
jgi:glycosyltransferase involved in cell wall biosynthesis